MMSERFVVLTMVYRIPDNHVPSNNVGVLREAADYLEMNIDKIPIEVGNDLTDELKYSHRTSAILGSAAITSATAKKHDCNMLILSNVFDVKEKQEGHES